jgi:lipoprotein-releasing system permease protein
MSGRSIKTNFSYFVALKYLWSRRGEASITVITVISIIGVAIGVITLNIVMAVMSGFQIELRSKILGTDAHITVKSTKGSISDWRTISKQLKEVTSVTSVSPFTYHQALLQTDAGAVGILIRGIEEKSAGEDQLIDYIEKAQKGSAQNVLNQLSQSKKEGLPGIVIGRELSRSLGLTTGSIVSILSPQTTGTPFGLMPRFRRFTVTGIYTSGLIEYEQGLAYTYMEISQNFFRQPTAVNGIELRVSDVDKAPLIASEISKILPRSLYASDWTQANAAFFQAMELEKRVYFIVLLLIIVMASFSIISSLVMLVIEKKRDIAILRTLGATGASIGKIFVIQGATVGAVGVVFGSLLGFGGCIALKSYGFPIDERIFQMSTLPIYIDPFNFLAIATCSFLICCISTIYPAKRAASLDPVEVLRYE